MLQNDDGFNLCRQLRATSPMPVIMLTGTADPTDRVVGLGIVADAGLRRASPTRLDARSADVDEICVRVCRRLAARFSYVIIGMLAHVSSRKSRTGGREMEVG
jgi:CheY-like chemotaxis protein